MAEVSFFDDETREVPQHILRVLPLINPGHYVLIIMDDGSRWDGFVSQSNDGLTWLVGGRPLFRVHYAPFKCWIIPWNIFAIVNIEDYRRYLQADEGK